MMKAKYNIGDEILIKNPLGESISKSVEVIAYTKDKIYYLTDSIDLAILGYEEDEICLNERAQFEKQVKEYINKIEDLIFDEQLKSYGLKNV